MAWIQIRWELSIPDPEEDPRGGDPNADEPSLQFVFVTAFEGLARAQQYSTGNLFPKGRFGTGVIQWPGNRPFGSVSSKNVPTPRNPFFGIAVRAVEEDNSGDREGANEDFRVAVQMAAQNTFNVGGVPTATVLWTAANSVRPRQSRIDPDDFIGASARVFPSYGTDYYDFYDEETRLGPGAAILQTREEFGLSFVSRAATEYQLDCALQVVGNDPTGPLLVNNAVLVGG